MRNLCYSFCTLLLLFQVSKERIRVLEFMADYDKLRCGRIPVPSFIRALDLCGFKLTPNEMNALAEKLVKPTIRGAKLHAHVLLQIPIK